MRGGARDREAREMRDGVAICREIGGQRGETHREVQEARGWETQETRDTEAKRQARETTESGRGKRER